MFKKFTISLVATLGILFSLSGYSLAADKYVLPEQKISGAEQPVAVGEIVRLTLNPPSSPPANLLKTSVLWKVFDGNQEQKFFNESENTIYFGTGTKKRTLTVIASVSYLFVEKKEGNIVDADVRSQLLKMEVKIGTGPDVPDDVTFPDGKYKLSSISYKLANDKVTVVDAKAAAKNLSNSYRGIASKIAAGGFTKVEDVLAQTTVSNRTALENAMVKKEDWTPALKALEDEVFKLYTNKTLVTLEDFKTAWTEIADGLAAVK